LSQAGASPDSIETSSGEDIYFFHSCSHNHPLLFRLLFSSYLSSYASFLHIDSFPPRWLPVAFGCDTISSELRSIPSRSWRGAERHEQTRRDSTPRSLSQWID
jgi:hypothetical protein